MILGIISGEAREGKVTFGGFALLEAEDASPLINITITAALTNAVPCTINPLPPDPVDWQAFGQVVEGSVGSSSFELES